MASFSQLPIEINPISISGSFQNWKARLILLCLGTMTRITDIGQMASLYSIWLWKMLLDQLFLETQNVY